MPELRTRLAATLIVVPLLLAGCTQNANEPNLAGNEKGYLDATKSVTLVPVDQRQPAPTLSGRLLGGTGTVSTADYPNKVVVVNVWGSWCPPCRAEAPDLQKASVQSAKKAQFIGLNTREYAEAAPLAFLRTQNISYPSIYDPDGAELVKLSGNLPLTTFPSSLVIDTKQRVAARIIGAISERTLVDLINDVAAGK